jgi:hypothetical protein
VHLDHRVLRHCLGLVDHPAGVLDLLELALCHLPILLLELVLGGGFGSGGVFAEFLLLEGEVGGIEGFLDGLALVAVGIDLVLGVLLVDL